MRTCVRFLGDVRDNGTWFFVNDNFDFVMTFWQRNLARRRVGQNKRGQCYGRSEVKGSKVGQRCCYNITWDTETESIEDWGKTVKMSSDGGMVQAFERLGKEEANDEAWMTEPIQNILFHKTHILYQTRLACYSVII